ncbi:hypothetical protein PHYBOEH_009077 [Phytophthora boehmeriae]|uniref:Centromere protein J C-terminal domain-containing protein n=1 Tax=Phytophthora boehmeriae TaxID=109152 RepID=A0A8T1VZR3_9STRA|nr:hypothetical protein PHYBOEH_009077 [Phytophthora boehmeriae]
MKTNGAKKKTFLKRGARGWWMRQPGAKQKVTKHILTSKDEDKEATLPVMGKTEQPEANQQQKPSSPSSSGTLSPVTSPPDRVRNTAARSQTLSPPVSPIRRLRYSSDGGSDDEKFQQQQQRQQIEEFAAWKEASLRSNASTDLMGMNRVRQSYEAKQQREANEMAEFEAIERDLAAEKEAYLLEREKPPQDLFHDNQAEESHWGLPYSSFVSDLHQQEHLRRHSTRVALMFDNSLDGGANSAPLFDDRSSIAQVIEEKLYELEEEVKFYKSETLQLQKRKDYYDQEMKKLARERDEFVHYQQEQRELIEKEWEKERAKMKKEQKLQERQWKLRMNATISHQDRKDRGEVEALKAQIVKMQLDEKARVAKWKSGSDNLRQRVLELEEKNRELSDEIKFLEKDRLEQWEKYERLLKGKHEMSTVTSKDIVTSAVAPAAPSELRTVDDIFAIKGTAEALLKDWSFPLEEEVPANGSKNQERVSIADSRLQQSVHLNIVDGYNPKRYSLGRSSDGSWTFTGGGCSEAKSDSPGVTSNGDGFRDGKNVNDNSATTGFKWAFPSADDEQALHNTAYSGSTSEDGDHNNDGIVLTSVTLHSEPKVVSQEIEHSGGKKELMYSDGSKKIVFPDGNVKDVDANGHIIIKFTNGDHKEIFPDTGISVYYYFEAKTKLTTYPDNRKVYEFPNQQIETSLPDGSTEIQFADGIKKTIRANGDEFSVFPDGTTMLEQPDGLREVTLLNQKKIRYFPDGEMACVSSSGQETRVQSDSELRKLMESS